MASIGQTLDRYKGLGPGFDCLRIGLATAIVVCHCFFLTGNVWFSEGPTWFTAYTFVPMFFALSGFLIAGSAMRLSLRNFLINRALRILPALAVDVVICALVIGPFVTISPLREYFSDIKFFKYFLNITGWIHYRLPGVFVHQAEDAVNASLWTVPFEMFCYAIMSGFIVTGFIRKPLLVLACAFGLLVAGLAVERYGYSLSYYPRRVVAELFMLRGATLVLAFILGIAMYQFRYVIPHSKWIAYPCVLICLGAAFILDPHALDHVANRFVVVPALVYLAIFLGLTPLPMPRVFHSGDYSYGVYLYHQPLLKVIVGLVPSFVMIPVWGALALAVLGLPAVVLFAAFSWHFVEKPVLGLRKRFSFVARIRGVASASDPGVAPVAPMSVADFGAPSSS